MECPSCQHASPPGANFCEQCGERLTPTCASCGAELSPTANFCGSCGQAFQAYTPRHLAEKILTQRSAMEGERKQVTVLFADLARSLPLSQQLSDEDYRTLVERLLLVLSEGVHRFEGTVNQYTGDGIMALFGAPIAHEDHAQRACYAALRIRDQLRGITEELRQQGIPFTTRIGLNSGSVIVGKIGDDLRMDWTAQGLTTNLAQRMEALAEPGAIYLAPETARLVEGYFDLDDLGPRKVKGIRQPLRVQVLKAVGRLRTRLEREQARGLSTLVGRSGELRVLHEALERTLAGQGRIVGVVGEAGVGKSRLCLDFIGHCQERGVRVDEAHCPSHGKIEPYGAILQLLRNTFRLRPAEPDEAARAHIAAELRELDSGFQESLPLLFDFLGMSDSDHPTPEMDSDARERRLLRLVAQIVQARSRREPRVLLLDDAHWIDSASDKFLAAMAQAVSGTRTLLLVNFRPEYDAAWMKGSDYQQLPLRPLGPEEASALLTELLGDAPENALLRNLIIEQTAGTPFFIEEVVQSLAESGTLSGSRGAYRIETPIAELTIPATVKDVLAARIDRLPEREKRVLQMAAVIGRQVPEALLGRVAELPETQLDAALGELRLMDFLHETTLFPDVVHEFKHPFTRDAALDSQLQDHRARIHASVATALQHLHGGRIHSEQVMLQIAHHRENAGERLEAARWYLRAFHPLLWRSSLEANRCAREALSALGDPRTLDPAEREFAVQLFAAAAGNVMHSGIGSGMSRAEADELFQRARELVGGPPLGSPALDRDVARTMVLLHVPYLESETLSPEDSLQHARHACALAEQTEDEGMRLFATFTLVELLCKLGRYAEAYEAARPDIESPPANPLVEIGIPSAGIPYTRILSRAAYARALTGSPREALSLVKDSIRLLRKDGRAIPPEEVELRGEESSYRSAAARGISGCVDVATSCYYFLGEAERASRCAQEYSDWAQDSQQRGARSLANFQLGLALRLQRRWEELAEVARRMDALHLAAFRARAGAWAAEARAHLGERSRAVEEVVALLGRREMEWADMLPRWGVERFIALVSCAHTLIYCDGAKYRDEVRAVLDRLQRTIEDTEARVYTPFLHELRAQLAQVGCDEETCERERSEAERCWTAMGATGHIERMALELEELRA